MNEGIGFICCIIAGVCFGSNFLPVKKYEVGDGIVFQWIMCCGILIVGLITVGFEKEREVHTLTMVGGALWCIGNAMCIQVIKLIGMSMGLMIWGITNSVMSWACGRFGLFGIDKESVGKPIMNYVGLALTVVSLALFSHVKASVKQVGRSAVQVSDDFTALSEKMEDESDKATEPHNDWIEKLDPTIRRVLGFGFACLCGLLFGVSFVPALHEKKHNSDDRLFDYAFSHFCGIFACSTVILLVYCIIKRNKPFANAQLFLPAMLSGMMWAVAQVCWFIAIQNLKMVIANPIVTALPSIVAGFWGIVVFREIVGARNLILFAAGLVIAVIGVIIVALSK